MSAHIFGVVSADTITNTMVLEPELAPVFAFLGELVDLHGMTPQPGIGWTRTDGVWSAPVPPEPEPEPEPEPDPEPEVGEADPETT